jgi:SPRY domain
MNPSHIGGRMRTGNGIEVGEGDSQHVAYLPLGAGEGRALRAPEAFPRSAPFASFSMTTSSSSGTSGQERRPRRVFGFKVAFEQPGIEEGERLGGNHLVGVTTTSFAAFSDKNALQQSPFFWGIEDNGRKYEGSRHHSVSQDHRRALSNYGAVLTSDVAPRGDDDVLFRCRQAITCVVDLESRTLTFWRDEDGERKLLSTVVTNLPRGGQLYPIVVPYKAGSTVAITGMIGDPLPL